ncbi:MAG TPA: S41 family peptidase [Brumimicrobium sp.]|nr:S41 family peptidase [Brumimicrobium sp.]
MKINLIVFCICVITTTTTAQTTCEKAADMVATINQFHYEAKPIDSSFSELFCELLIDKVDAYGLFLSSEDVSALKSASYFIANDIKSDSCVFYDQFTELINNGINASKSILEKLNNQDFALMEGDSITLDRGKFFVKQSEIENRWKKWLQYLTVSAIETESVESAQLDSIYRTILSREQCRLDSYFINNSLDKKMSEWYLTSIANTFDPHTNYFSGDNKESYFGSLSDEGYSFGFDLDRNESGRLKVASVIPGGAAWKSNRVNEGLILNSVIANEKVKDFSCIRFDDAMNFLNSSDLKNAKFIFETEKGVLDTISLSKTLITVQENIVQSFILKDSINTVGYIYLPSFYSSENEYGISTNGCAADISREIIRLKKEGIEALIIDLRNNGGGHMLEAVNLIGIFIDYGTLGAIDDVGKKPVLIKDMNRGLIYDGPLTVMINEYSASASEFFAVTLQDYHRALIVGSTSFGKSTAQTVLPIEAHRYPSPEQMDFESKDFVKLTVSRFYRVNGDTYQGHGVIPDLIFPSILDGLETGEQASPSALLANHIDKETYFKTPYTLPRTELKEMFDIRNANNPYFKLVEDISVLHSDYWKTTTYFIGLNSNNKQLDAYLEGLEEYHSFELRSPYTVNNPSYLAGYSNQHDSEKEINSTVMEDIKEDQAIIETFMVTQDLINIKNNK